MNGSFVKFFFREENKLKLIYKDYSIIQFFLHMVFIMHFIIHLFRNKCLVRNHIYKNLPNYTRSSIKLYKKVY